MNKFMKRIISLLLCAVTLVTAAAMPASAVTAPADPETKGETWHKIIVNPWNKLPSDYKVKLSSVRGYKVDSRCAYYLSKMLKDCEKAGHEPLICSAYRTNSYQTALYNNKVNYWMNRGYSRSKAKVKAATSVAVPGTSEHQLGLAVDIIDMDYQYLTSSQAKTNTQKWLMKNSWKYGFILRYPSGTTDITGIIYEPWHYRYVGKTLAEDIYKSGLTMEEYFGAVQPKKVSVKNNLTSGKNVISWNKVNNAEKYRVYRATSKDGDYKRIYTTSKTTYTDTTAVAGTKYYYCVRAVTKYDDVSEPSSKVVRTCDLPRLVISISSVASTGKVRIQWAAVEGAVKYEVYKSNSSSGEFKKIYTTKATSFTNTSAVPGEVCYFKVKAIAKNTAANSALSYSKYRTCDLPRPAISISNVAATGKVKIQWKAIEGAVSYEVYRRYGSSGEFVKVADTKATSFTDEESLPGDICYFKVKAIASKSAADSDFSICKYRTCDLPTVTLSLTHSEEGTPVLSWNGVEGAAGYALCRADSETGTYTEIYRGPELSFTDLEAPANARYKMTVLAEKSAADSAYSNIVH